MNLSNKLTIFRIILVPILLIVGIVNPPGELLGISITCWIMLAIFVVASITDRLDGYLARSRNMVTTFGKFLDPIADKILVLTVMILFVEFDKMPAWIPIIVLFREFTVSGFRLIAVEKSGEVIAASVWGKIKTVTQMIGLILMFVDRYSYGYFIFNPIENVGLKVLNIAAFAMITISVIATVVSGINYLVKGKDLLKD